jgi:transposase-like protein
MCYPQGTIDFPIAELMDDRICASGENGTSIPGVVCPRCGGAKRRLFRAQEHFPAYRCRTYEGDYTLLTETVFEKTRPRPATLVVLRHCIQANLNDTAPTSVMTGTAFEADERYQNVGETKHAAS